ncbi:6783_t:CDS:2 [Ambispora leptoticha]|uniref:6783_t:CDS:1 n=1 Tax=Ambispora leptoticha TaxID=144679 RepID=A0A9N8ZMJ1_9GLOM|nr:6783_t:CDS:2 [Ambispora leptoticha]
MTSISASPRKRRLSVVSPEEGRRVSISEPNNKKVKSDSTTGSITSGTIPIASNISNNNDAPIVSAAPKTLHHKSGSISSSIENMQTSNTTASSVNNSNTNVSSGTTIMTSATLSPTTLEKDSLNSNVNNTLNNSSRVKGHQRQEEEVQNLLGELQTLSQTLTPDFTFDPALRKKFLDPAINALFRTMKKELEEKEKMIEDLRNELDGISFTPNSITGKKLVAKLRALQHENEELGRQLRQGRVEQYEVEIAMQRKVIDELKAGLEESDAQSLLMDEENERLQDIEAVTSNEAASVVANATNSAVTPITQSPEGEAEEKSGGNKNMPNDDVDMADNEDRELQSNEEENKEKGKIERA